MSKDQKDFDKWDRFQTQRYYVNKFIQKISRVIPPGSDILDAGAGECVYKKYFKHCRYFSADYAVGDSDWDYSHIDYVCKLSEIPVPDNNFDYILCTQALEHVYNPDEVLAELNRVLKKGGKLFLSAPLIHQEHQLPHDYYRYTKNGLRYLLEKNNFEIQSLEHGGSYLLVSARFLKHMPALIFRSKYLFFLRWPSLALTNLIYRLIVILDNDENNRNNPDAPTFNYMVTAVKK